MPAFHELSTVQLRQALQLREQIESLQQKLDALFGGASTRGATPSKAKSTAAGRTRGKRTMSPEARARIGDATRARWAKLRDKKAAPAKASAKAGSRKRELTPEGRAKLAAAMKARWAARKKGAAASSESGK